MHALIRDGQIIEAGPLPLPAWFDGARWHDLRDPAIRTAAGWVEVVEEPRPADTETTTWERADPALVAGVPTVGWTERAKTPEELAADVEQANAETISSRLITTDLPAMQAILDQTNADLRADPSQEIKDLARAVRRLTRKVESILDGTD